MNEPHRMSLLRRVLSNFVVRLLLVAAVLLAALVLRDICLAMLRSATGLGEAPSIWLGRTGNPEATPLVVFYAVAAAMLSISFCWVAYALYVRAVERRPLSEFAVAHLPRELIAGLGVGVALIGTPILLLLLLGNLRIVAVTAAMSFVIVGASAPRR